LTVVRAGVVEVLDGTEVEERYAAWSQGGVAVTAQAELVARGGTEVEMA